MKKSYIIILGILITLSSVILFIRFNAQPVDVKLSTEYAKIENAPSSIKNWINDLGNEFGLYLSKGDNNGEFYLYVNKSKIIALKHNCDSNGEINITASLETYSITKNNDTYFKFRILNRKPQYVIVNNIKIYYNDIKIIN